MKKSQLKKIITEEVKKVNIELMFKKYDEHRNKTKKLIKKYGYS